MKKVISLFVISSLFLLFGCAATRTSESTGQYIDNSVITAKVKGKLIADESLSGLLIKVKTFKGTVQLSGFVNSQAQKHRAGSIAASVPDVMSVRNDIIVKTQAQSGNGY